MTGEKIAFFISEFRDMLDEWSREYGLNISGSLQFTGGEPCLRDDLVEILEAGADKGFKTFLMTNGTLIDGDGAERIKNTGVEAVQISLDGMPETHDKVRGHGSFDKAAAGLQALAEAGVEVTVNVTLSKMNLPEIERLATTARELGAARIGFARLVPEGRGEVMSDDMLSAKEVETAYCFIKDLKIDGLQLMTRDPISCLVHDGGESTSCGDVAVAGCAAGLSGVSIMPDGTVMPCRRMNFGIGNINEEPLREIWAASPVLNNLRDKSQYTGKCGDCELWDQCRGCRAIAYAASKDLGMPDYLADDPQCWKS